MTPRRGRDAVWWAGLAGRALLVAVVLYLPQFYGPVVTNKLSTVIYLSVAVLSLNLLIGLNGQVSIGHSAFFGLGAYTTAILVADHGWPYLATFAPAAALAFGAGVLTGLPALRLRGFYMALASLGIGMVFPQLVQRFTSVTGGTAGRGVPADLSPPDWTGLAPDQWRYYVLLTIAALAFLVVRNITQSRIGRALMAIRDNDIAARTAGVDVARYRVLTFGTSAAIAAVAGSMFTIHNQFVASTDFGLMRSIDLLVGMVVGGGTSLAGAVIGGAFLQYAPEYIQDFGVDPLLTPVLYGALLLFCVYVFKDGVAGTAKAALRRWRAQRRAAEAVAVEPAMGARTRPDPPEPLVANAAAPTGADGAD